MEISKLVKGMLRFSIVVVIMAISTSTCFAMNTGFEVTNKSEDEISVIFSRLNLELIEEPEIMTRFSCFDINESGDYILGFDLLEKDIILAYNSEGTYLYGFSFVDGGAFGIEWDGNNIILYRVRSDIAILIDKQGTCLDIKTIQNTLRNSEYWRKEVNANKRIVNDVTYTAEHWLFNSELFHWGTYPLLVRTTLNGNRTILFDATSNFLPIVASLLALIGIPIAFSIMLFLHHRKTVC